MTTSRFIPAAIRGAGFAALTMLTLAGPLQAQSTTTGGQNALQGFSQNRDQPIQIEAASLEMRDKKKEATFTGNVKVVQGDTTMTSKSLVVFYDGGAQSGQGGQGSAKSPKAAPAATPGPDGSSAIRRLEARGDVKVTQKDQVVTGETAVYDTKTNMITMQGGVVLTQCKNVMRGDRLTVDMTTGVSRVESDGRGVQMLLPQAGAGSGAGGGCGPSPGAPANAAMPLSPGANKLK